MLKAICLKDGEKMKNTELIRKINKEIVHNDGTIDSFDKQLIQLISGVYDTRFPLVISENTNSLNYIEGFSVNNPLVMNVSTVIKLREKHDIGYAFVSNCEKYLEESVLAFDSYQHDTSKIILLEEVDDDGFPMIAICRENKDMGGNFMLNEITSIYEKEKLEQLLNRSYDKNAKFYTNEKTERYIKSIGLQLSKGLTYALSDSYFRNSFNKSQVEQDLNKMNMMNVTFDEYYGTWSLFDEYEKDGTVYRLFENDEYKNVIPYIVTNQNNEPIMETFDDLISAVESMEKESFDLER